MIKISLDVEEGIIKKALIAGDFFLYPEEAIEHIEKSLIGVRVDSPDVEKVLAATVANAGAQLLGVSVEDIAFAVKLALESKV